MTDPQPNLYEIELVKIMSDDAVPLSVALETDFRANSINTKSMYDITDYLETKFIGPDNETDMDKVDFYMGVYSGYNKDVYLKKI